MEDGSFWSLSDNGFGSKLNSPDAMLMLHNVKFDWDKGTVERVKTVFLSDPDKKAPFPIVMEGAESAIDPTPISMWDLSSRADSFLGRREFGPFLLKFDMDGKLTDVFDFRRRDGSVVAGQSIALPANQSLKLPTYNLRRSGGFEGLAMSKDDSSSTVFWKVRFCRWRAGKTESGKTGLRSSNSSVADKKWTVLTSSICWPGGEAIGDFNMLDETWRWSSSVTTASARRTRPAPIRRSRRPIALDVPSRSAHPPRSLS